MSTDQDKKYEEMPIEEPDKQDGLECGVCADTKYQAVTSEEDFQALLKALNVDKDT
ncbi:hypothetical protein [Aerococcus sp. UMB7834]|uniref:hypothetical protein n=1 Tax=Aerococcus sp. UMB7834 TaxID=3046342 RepID=UPI002551C773|nr:hypothetical protein [Aerococcus sp. UMB7834]MDK6804856.1 hypothetical protein [Aerococcus sp. UMB7834]